MNITTNKGIWDKTPKTTAVSTYVADSLRSVWADGQIETVEYRVGKILDAVGSMVDILASKGVLTADEIVQIAGEKYSTNEATLSE